MLTERCACHLHDAGAFNDRYNNNNSVKKPCLKKFKMYGKGHMMSLKPQKSSEGLTGYFLTRWFRTKVSITFLYSYQRTCKNGFHFIITCRMGCQKQNVLQISGVICLPLDLGEKLR
jgi:hypothetical protein